MGIGGRGRCGGGGMPAGRLVYVEPGIVIDMCVVQIGMIVYSDGW